MSFATIAFVETVLLSIQIHAPTTHQKCSRSKKIVNSFHPSNDHEPARYQVLRTRMICVKENHCQEHMKITYIYRILLIEESWKERPVWHSIARYEVLPITTGNALATKTLFPVQNARPANTQKQWRRLLFCKLHVVKY